MKLVNKTHMAFGATAAALISQNHLGPVGTPTLTLLSGAILGSITPDIDRKESAISRILGFHLSFLERRGFTHSILGLICFQLLVLLIPSYAFQLGAFIGYAAHILLDMINSRGVKLCWPEPREYKFGLSVMVGGIVDANIRRACLICLFVYYGILLLQQA